MQTTTSGITYQGSKGNYTVRSGGLAIATVTGAGKAWVATSHFGAGTHTATSRAAAVAALVAAVPAYPTPPTTCARCHTAPTTGTPGSALCAPCAAAVLAAPHTPPPTVLPCPHTGVGPCGACGLCGMCSTVGPYAMCGQCGAYGACGNCGAHHCHTATSKPATAPVAPAPAFAPATLAAVGVTTPATPAKLAALAARNTYRPAQHTPGRTMPTTMAARHTVCPGGCTLAAAHAGCGYPAGNTMCPRCQWCYQCSTYATPAAATMAARRAATPAAPASRYYWQQAGTAWHVYCTGTTTRVATVWQQTPGHWVAMAPTGALGTGSNPVRAVRATTWPIAYANGMYGCRRCGVWQQAGNGPCATCAGNLGTRHAATGAVCNRCGKLGGYSQAGMCGGCCTCAPCASCCRCGVCGACNGGYPLPGQPG